MTYKLYPGRPSGPRLIHGHSPSHNPSPTYVTWQGMIQRCYDLDSPNFRFYGAKGITVCNRWKKFENFLSDMGLRPAGKTIERIDNSSGYSTKNCRWASKKEQQRNTVNNILLSFCGSTRCLSEWCERLKLPYGTIRHRIKYYHWSVERALTVPIRYHKHHIMRKGRVC